MIASVKRFIAKKKSCSCSMPGVWRAAAYCKGAVVIFHSPQACTNIVNNMEINSLYRNAALSDDAFFKVPVPLISSQLKEKNAIFGGNEKLADCIDFVVKQYTPDCIVIANSCVAGIIGDDVDAAGRKAEEEYNLPVITVNCCGFLDGEYYQGYIETAEKLVKKFFKKQKDSLPKTALLLGDNGGPAGSYVREVTRLLNALGVCIVGQFPGYMPINEMQEAAKAEAVIVLGSVQQAQAGLAQLAKMLAENFGMKYIPSVYPIGSKKTKQWLADMGRLFNCAEKAAELADREEKNLLCATAEFCLKTAQKSTVLFIGRLTVYFDPGQVIEIVNKLRMHLRGIVMLDVYEEKERKKMENLLKKYTDATIYNGEYPNKLLENVQVILTTHELKNCRVKQIFLPMLPKAGTSGEIGFMQIIYQTLCSRSHKGGIVYV
ncbi:nitrogenase component 1 [Pectinatus sottacetonis]|uniref:nitrogenase component 1 n=1 Tax=Pectinatus sottacetonis TaxID=1002795 RepID=UPI0018C839F9|nr:nitrogenase component 1 [Pectinatus sottacetonis]